MQGMQERIEDSISGKIIDMKSNVGGSLSESRLLVTDDGRKLFLKFDFNQTGTLQCEAYGIRQLEKYSQFRLPKVFAVQNDFLVTEYIESCKPDGNFYAKFGETLAQLHSQTFELHGWPHNNFIGPTKQINDRYGSSSWAHFFVHSRIKPQITWLKQKKLWPMPLCDLEEDLIFKIFEVLTQSQGHSKSLLHGDLWSGNFLCDSENRVVLIDPACYWGHNEADLSISRLFGGSTKIFTKPMKRFYPLKLAWRNDLKSIACITCSIT